MIGPDRSPYTLPAEASGRKAVKLAPGQYVEFTMPGPPTRSRSATASRTLRRRRNHRAARRHGGRQAPPDHDAHVAVRLAVQPVSVLQRPERRRAAPGLVDHRVRVRAGVHRRRRPSREAVPAHALLRRAAPAARQDLQGGRQGPPHGARRAARRVDRHRPARLRARRPADVRLVPPTCCCSAPTRPADGLGRRVRPGHRVRQETTSRCTSRRAPTR